MRWPTTPIYNLHPYSAKAESIFGIFLCRMIPVRAFISASQATLPRKSKTLIFAVASAVLLLLVTLFQWNIIDAISPFLALPLFGIIWLTVIATVVWSLAYAYRHRREGRDALAPLAVSAGALLAAFYVPFTQLWLYANFHLKEEARTQVIAKVRAGELRPNVSHNAKIISLPGYGVSNGDAIIIEGERDNPYVFFFTYRGILDNHSGFLWVPEGGDPSQFGDASDKGTEITHYGGHWYFVGHR